MTRWPELKVTTTAADVECHDCGGKIPAGSTLGVVALLVGLPPDLPLCNACTHVELEKRVEQANREAA